MPSEDNELNFTLVEKQLIDNDYEIRLSHPLICGFSFTRLFNCVDFTNDRNTKNIVLDTATLAELPSGYFELRVHITHYYSKYHRFEYTWWKNFEVNRNIPFHPEHGSASIFARHEPIVGRLSDYLITVNVENRLMRVWRPIE
ncbi:MAG: hypothetical protein WC477_01370 [Patescibacteria group bacterium]